MIGEKFSSYVKLSTPLAFQIGSGKSIVVQEILDSILPGILPLCCVSVSFGILKIKSKVILH